MNPGATATADDAAAAAAGQSYDAAANDGSAAAATEQLWRRSPAAVPRANAAGGPTIPPRHEPRHARDAAEDAGDAGRDAHRHDALPSPITTADCRAVSKPRPVPKGGSHGNGAKSTHASSALQPGAGSDRGWQHREQPWGGAGRRQRRLPQCDDASQLRDERYGH